MLNRIG